MAPGGQAVEDSEGLEAGQVEFVLAHQPHHLVCAGLVFEAAQTQRALVVGRNAYFFEVFEEPQLGGAGHHGFRESKSSEMFLFDAQLEHPLLGGNALSFQPVPEIPRPFQNLALRIREGHGSPFTEFLSNLN